VVRQATIVTFDVFSALTDSRAGGSRFLQSAADANSWSVAGTTLYDRWDALNKQSHREVDPWASFADLSALALRATMLELELPPDEATALSRELLDSMTDWPLWPDVSARSLRDLPASGLGLLSNIDDGLLAGTAAMRLGVFEPALVVTSERAQAYKPSAALYHRATELIGPFVHVASSARDVGGSVSAGIRCIRLERPGHSLDPTGPAPLWTAHSVSELRDLVPLAAGPDDRLTTP
jgi:2-haloacid dehalogenase